MQEQTPQTSDIPNKLPDIQAMSENPSKTPKKHFTLLVGASLVLLISLGIGGYWVSQNNFTEKQLLDKPISSSTMTLMPTSLVQATASTTPTTKPLLQSSDTSERILTDWQNYENEKYGFKISNPGQFILIEYPNDNRIRLYTLSGYKAIEKRDYIHGIPFINISGYENPQKLSALDWAKNQNLQTDVTVLGEYETKEILGREGVTFSWGTNAGGGESVILLNQNDIIEFVNIGFSEEEFENVISTLIFL